MRRLLRDPAEAAALGAEARRAAERRFGIGRFVADWDRALRLVTGMPTRSARRTVADLAEVPG
jgi:hypothetical protein